MVCRLQVNVNRVQIRAMGNKWGSISTAGTLTLAAALLALPVTLVEYVVVLEGYSICMLHRSRHLSAVNRQGIERLTRRLAEELLDFVTNPRFAVLIEGQNADPYHYYSQFSDFSFWDQYVPGLTAEVQHIHRSWAAHLARLDRG